MLRDASQRDGCAEACVLALRCDAPQHEGEQLSLPWPRELALAMLRGRLKDDPAAVGNAHRPRSPVSGLFFTGTGATPTCRYCFGMPARSITAAHLPMSAASRALNSSGVLALASMPSSA